MSVCIRTAAFLTKTAAGYSQQQYEYDPEKPIYLEAAHICPVNALYLIGTPAKPIGAVVLIPKMT